MLMRMCHTAVLCKSCTCSLRSATMSKLAPIDRACSHHCPLPNPRVQYKQPSPQSLLAAGWPSDRRPILPGFITSPAVLLEHSETVIATPRHVRDERHDISQRIKNKAQAAQGQFFEKRPDRTMLYIPGTSVVDVGSIIDEKTEVPLHQQWWASAPAWR